MSGRDLDIYACGFQENELLTIILTNPLGQVILELEKRPTPEMDDDTTVHSYCHRVHEISKYDFLPGDTLGRYVIEILGNNTRLIHSFELKPITEPVVYYSDRAAGYVLAGLAPFEEARIIVYEWKEKKDSDGREHYFEIRKGQLELDENGIGLLTDPTGTTHLVIVGERFDLLSTRAGFIPPNYDQIFSADSPHRYYFRGMETEEAADKLAVFTQAIQLAPDYLPAYRERARIYAEQGVAAQAIADYTTMIELAPEDPSLYEARARLYEQQGKFSEAVADYSQLIELDSTRASIFYARARLFDLQGEYDQALSDYVQAIELDRTSHLLVQFVRNELSYEGTIADFTRAIELSPGYALAYYMRAETYLQEGESEILDEEICLVRHSLSDQIVADLSKAIELEPDFLPAYYVRGRFYKSQGQYTQAIADYSQLIERAPDYLPPYIFRARLLERLNMIDRAIADYSRVIERAPTHLTAMQERAILYERQNNFQLAIEDLSSAIGLDPDSSSNYTKRAMLYERKNDYAAAIADYNKAVELHPWSSVVYYARARFYYGQADYQRALADYTSAIEHDQSGSQGDITDYSRIIELAPNYAPSYYFRGMEYIGEGNYEQAIADFDRAIQLDPEYVLAYAERADLYERYNDYDRALADYNKIIELDPKSPAAHRARAGIHERRNNPSQAIADYTATLELFPQDIVAYYGRARLYDRQGDYLQALSDYEVAVILDIDEYGCCRSDLTDVDRVIELDPGFALAYYLRGLVHQRDENDDQAIADFERFLELSTDEDLRREALEYVKELRGE